MKKTLLTLFTTIAVCGMSYSQVYAQIDVSVFENKADYDVDMDDFDDTGEISFVGGDNMPSGTVIGNPDGDSGYISGELDIKIIDDGNIAAPRMTLLYTGDDWIFTDKIIIKTESHRYTFDVDSRIRGRRHARNRRIALLTYSNRKECVCAVSPLKRPEGQQVTVKSIESG